MFSSAEARFPNPRAGAPPALPLAVVLSAWFLLAVGGGLSGWFIAPRTQPPLAILLAIAVPPLAFALLYQTSRRFAALVLSLDLKLITSLQSFRVIGAMFLVLYAFGLLPPFFAIPAGLGDLAVGLAAPFLALRIARDAPGWPRQIYWFNLLGLLDFVFAVGTGVLTSNTSLGVLADHTLPARANLAAFPLSLVPTFLVPLYIILHAIALLQLAQTSPKAAASVASTTK
jgi:hypothetical protein